MVRSTSAASKVTMVSVMAITMVLITILLQGCTQEKKEKVVAATDSSDEYQVSLADIRSATESATGSAFSSYECNTATGMTSDKRFWCMGHKAWLESEYSNEGEEATQNEFIEAWKLGALDAQQARDPAVENLRSRPVAAAGYESGYISVLDATGIVEYECSDGDETDNEYRDRWCEASIAYNSSRMGAAHNAVLRAAYVNGYMSGRAIALTLPTSMESLFGDEPPQDGGKRAIDELGSAASPKAIKTFNTGFHEGFQAMIDTVRESVNQVMEQMQGMDGMPGMEGMPGDGMPGMPGMPGMDGMMPGMGDMPMSPEMLDSMMAE